MLVDCWISIYRYAYICPNQVAFLNIEPIFLYIITNEKWFDYLGTFRVFHYQLIPNSFVHNEGPVKARLTAVCQKVDPNFNSSVIQRKDSPHAGTSHAHLEQ